MITDIVQWVTQFIDFPYEFQFILYILVSAILLVLLIIAIDFFGSLFLAIFNRRR